MQVLPPPIDGKVDIAQKRLIVGSPDQFSWIPHVLTHQNCCCPNFFRKFYYFYYFYIVIRFLWRKQYKSASNPEQQSFFRFIYLEIRYVQIRSNTQSGAFFLAGQLLKEQNNYSMNIARNLEPIAFRTNYLQTTQVQCLTEADFSSDT